MSDTEFPPTPSFVNRAVYEFVERRRVEFRALSRLAKLEQPGAVADAGFESIVREFDALNVAGVSLYRSPRFLLWLSSFRRVMLHGIASDFGDGSLTSHLHNLSRIVLGQAAKSGSSYSTRERLDREGYLNAPGSGAVLFAGRARGGKEAELSTSSGEIGAEVEGHRFQASLVDGRPAPEYGQTETEGWFRLPFIGQGVPFDRDPQLVCSSSTNKVLDSVGVDLVSRWQPRLDEAMGLIDSTKSTSWVPVETTLRTIVPVQALKESNVSYSIEPAIGAVMLSLPKNGGYLAEALVHESAHSLLNVFIDGTRLWTVDDRGRSYKSPWRTDPRPIRGIVHGIFAFDGVASFWKAVSEGETASKHQGLARERLRAVHEQLSAAIHEIRDSDELTPAGRELLDQMSTHTELFRKTD